MKQTVENKARGFAVDDVVPATIPLRSRKLSTGGAVHHVSPTPPLVELMGSSHPLVGAVQQAFAGHYPLVLSPDVIWLVLAQGFSHHVNENAEDLRYSLVRHAGKVELEETIHSFTPVELARAASGFSAQIREQSNPVLHEALVCDFSTTTADIRTASELVMMDTYSRYFDYVMKLACGIPQVTLTGLPEDWEKLRARVEVLAAYDLEWWVRRLRPILDELVMASRGRPTIEFWRSIYQPVSRLGMRNCSFGPVEHVGGWLADLFPYLGDSQKYRNEGPDGKHRDPSPSEFPSGLSVVPIKLNAKGVSVGKMELAGGFLGATQDGDDLALSPVIGWKIHEAEEQEAVPGAYFPNPGRERLRNTSWSGLWGGLRRVFRNGSLGRS